MTLRTTIQRGVQWSSAVRIVLASTLASTLLLLIAPGTAHAADNQKAAEDTTGLQGILEEEVVTTASKSAEQTSDAPALSRSISAEDIRRYGITSVDEALNFLGVGIRVQRGLGEPEISVRGVGFTGDRGNHALVLVDGHVINEPLYGSASIGQGLGVPH
jgi:outer membrane receptor for ferrienterochelin and colicin